jgi:hypothetical protein
MVGVLFAVAHQNFWLIDSKEYFLRDALMPPQGY